jgi:hypothetical protein
MGITAWFSRSYSIYTELRVGLKHVFRPWHSAWKHPMKGLMAKNDCDKCENESLGICAAQLAFVDPGHKVARDDFNQLTEVPAQERVEVFTHLKSAILKEAEELWAQKESLRDQFKCPGQDSAPIACIRYLSKQISPQAYLA